MLGVPATIFALLASLSPVAAVSLPEPPTGQIPVEVVSANGGGCPAGSVSASMSQDNTALLVTYANYLATVGGAAKPTDARKNCHLTLKITLPPGYTYAISSVDLRGSAHLEAGAKARIVGDLYFAGMPQNAPIPHVISGPYDGAWIQSESFVSLAWQPCGVERLANLSSELRVSRGTPGATATSEISFLPETGEASTRYNLAWTRCAV